MFIVSEHTAFFLSARAEQVLLLPRKRIVVTAFTINISRLAARNHFGTRSGSDGIKGRRLLDAFTGNVASDRRRHFSRAKRRRKITVIGN